MRIIARNLLLALALLAPALARAADRDGEGFESLTVNEVSLLVAQGKADVFDNNSHDRYLESHVAGARWVAFNRVTAGDLPRDKERKVVFYCANKH